MIVEMVAAHSCHLARQPLICLGDRDERDEVHHQLAILLRPSGPRVRGEGFAQALAEFCSGCGVDGLGEEKPLVQVYLERFVDRLVPMGHGHVLEAFLYSQSTL